MKTNIIYHESCVDTMFRLPDHTIDLTVTSPPYDKLRSYGGHTFNNFKQIARELFRVTKKGGVLVWVVGDQVKDGDESGTSFKQALYFKKIGFNLFDTMIYAKPARGGYGSRYAYWSAFEYMFVFCKYNSKPKTINLIMDRENKTTKKGSITRRLVDGSLKRQNYSGHARFGRRTNVWEYQTGMHKSSKDKLAFQHPAIFPEKLAGDHIVSWSNEGDLVYDPFMGSGTTAIMAMKNKRKYIGSEVHLEYCELAELRLSRLNP